MILIQVICCSFHTISFHSVCQSISIFELLKTLSCIALDALNSVLLTNIVTLLANFVRNNASSHAVSHHHITIRCLSRNIGNHPSQTAQADIHLCRYFSSHGKPNLLAVAHVEIIILLVKYSCHDTNTLNGLEDKSTLSTVFVSILVPLWIDCSLIFCMSSGHQIETNHGKFSISVVVVSCHQAATHHAINHSNISGFKFALAA